MKYTHFEIENFKGIERIRLDLGAAPKAHVYTLVGLNESGKTTVLQAINLLQYREELDSLGVPGYADEDVHDLIPIAKRANFNDSVAIRAHVVLGDGDEQRVRKELAGQNIHLDQPIGELGIEQQYGFKNSRVIENQPKVTWSIDLRGRVAGQRRTRRLGGEALQTAVKQLRTLLPRILYFPNFLFEFPDRIYLENAPSDEEKHTFYRTVLQDVLDAIGGGINLKDHVLERAKSKESFDERSLESVLLKMGGHITKTVFTNWDKIFKRGAGKKEILVTIANEGGTKPWYVQLRLKDGGDLYSISERSLGFRWFFTFLLLTQYRGFRKSGTSNVLFLLDEPASNLHPSAQAQLLDSFQNFPPDCGIIYTTHSHHMIKPEWLEGTFVVKNEGLDYSRDQDEYSARKTVITLHRYRDFAAQHPDQSTYFQPVLDVLDYRPGLLELVPDVVMLEGKYDFYTLMFAQQVLGSTSPLFLLPGSGAGSLVEPIRLYVAWARGFIVLLDSDTEGDRQRERYKQLFGSVVEGRIFTLADADQSWKGIRMEQLFDPSDLIAIQKAVYADGTSFNKTHFNRAVQELFLTKASVVLSQVSRDNFERLLAFCRTALRPKQT